MLSLLGRLISPFYSSKNRIFPWNSLAHALKKKSWLLMLKLGWIMSSERNYGLNCSGISRSMVFKKAICLFENEPTPEWKYKILNLLHHISRGLVLRIYDYYYLCTEFPITISPWWVSLSFSTWSFGNLWPYTIMSFSHTSMRGSICKFIRIH